MLLRSCKSEPKTLRITKIPQQNNAERFARVCTLIERLADKEYIDGIVADEIGCCAPRGWSSYDSVHLLSTSCTSWVRGTVMMGELWEELGYIPEHIRNSGWEL